MLVVRQCLSDCDQELTTHLLWREWDRYLANYPDQRFRAYITNGIRNCFRFGFDYRHAISQIPPEYVISTGETAGGKGLPGTWIQRRKSPGPTWTFVVPSSSHLVYLVRCHSKRVNREMAADSWHVRGKYQRWNMGSTLLPYVGVKDAAKGLWEHSIGALMAKVEVKSADHNIPIHPDDRWMMGML